VPVKGSPDYAGPVGNGRRIINGPPFGETDTTITSFPRTIRSLSGGSGTYGAPASS